MLSAQFFSKSFMGRSTMLILSCLIALGALTLAPDVVYAAYSTPSPTVIDPISLNCPQPPESDLCGWVAISDGVNVRVHLISYVPDSTSILGGSPHVEITNVDNVNNKITLAYYSTSPGDVTITRWDSDGPSYRLINTYNDVISTAYTYTAWPSPDYIAYGGCVTCVVDDYSLVSFSPLWNSGSGGDSGSSQNYWSVLNSISESLRNINNITGNLEMFVEQSGDDISDIEDLLSSINSVTNSLSRALVAHSNYGDIYYSISSSIDRFTSPELFSLLDELNVKLSALSGLSESVDTLNQSIVLLEDSFSQISSDIQELTSAIEKETEIWELASRDYHYDSANDSASRAWSWFSDLFSFIGSASDIERGSTDFYYQYSGSSPGDAGRLEVIDWYYIFGYIFDSGSPSLPGDNGDVPGWDHMSLRGLP